MTNIQESLVQIEARVGIGRSALIQGHVLCARCRAPFRTDITLAVSTHIDPNVVFEPVTRTCPNCAARARPAEVRS